MDAQSAQFAQFAQFERVQNIQPGKHRVYNRPRWVVRPTSDCKVLVAVSEFKLGEAKTMFQKWPSVMDQSWRWTSVTTRVTTNYWLQRGSSLSLAETKIQVLIIRTTEPVVHHLVPILRWKVTTETSID